MIEIKKQTPFSKKKMIVRTGIVGGGKGCYELLKLFHSYLPVTLDVYLVGVADPKKNAVGRLYAQQHGITTFDNQEELLHLLNLDLVIELTGKDSVLERIYLHKQKKTKVIDHLGARFLWEIIAIQEKKIALEQRVSTLDTMTAVGEMAYRLTDKLRNPLMIAGGTVRRTMTRIDLPHGVRKKLKMVAGSIQKMEDVLSDICDVIRPLNLHFMRVDLNSFFDEFCRAVNIEAQCMKMEFSCIVEEELPEIIIDPSLLRQALWHLLENCFEVTGNKPTPIQLRVLLCYDALIIQIEDTGGGLSAISPQAAVHPFTTTHSGRMGLGLTICRQIIQEHHGELELWNNQQGGVTATIHIPLFFSFPDAK